MSSPLSLDALIIEQAADALIYCDTTGIIRRWNHAAERLFGYDAPVEAPTLEAVERKLHPDDVDAYWNDIDGLLVKGGDSALEFRVVRPDGEIRWIASRTRASCISASRPTRTWSGWRRRCRGFPARWW